MAYARRFAKRIRKGAKRVYKKVIHPYVNKKKGYANRMKLYKEVGMLKRMVNAEKKYVEGNINGQGVAQLFNGADGIYCATVTPTIAVGAAYNQRNGNSIRLSGLYIRGRFTQQTNTINPLRFHVDIMTVKGAPQSTSNIISGMYDPDSLSGVRDYFCSRNPAQYTDYRIISSRKYYVKQDTIATGATNVDFCLPLKLKHHLRWNTSNVIQEGELFIIIRGDAGDGGTPLTGCFFSASFRLSYFDN